MSATIAPELAEWIRRQLDTWPPLTSEQRASIASLATGGPR